MQSIDLGIIKINYKKEDQQYMMILESILAVKLEPLKKYLDDYQKIVIEVRFNEPVKNRKNVCYINVTQEEPYINQLYQKSYQIIRAILKNNIKPCYYSFIEYLILLIFNYNMEYPLAGCIEDYLKNVYSPKKELSSKDSFCIQNMRLTYLVELYGKNIWNLFRTQEIDLSKITKEAYQYLKQKYVININQIKTPEDVLRYILANIKYGWIQNNRYIPDISLEVLEKYKIPTVEEVIQNNVGCCIDSSRVASFLLEKLGFPSHVNIRKKDIGGKIQYHAYTLYCDSGIWYRMDINSDDERCIRKVNTLESDKIYEQKNGSIVETLPKEIDGLEFHYLMESVFKDTKKEQIKVKKRYA